MIEIPGIQFQNQKMNDETVQYNNSSHNNRIITVPHPGKGVCADPVNGAAILGKEGPEPQGGNKGCQLSPDKGREKT
jgi:hypothetical protein